LTCHNYNKTWEERHGYFRKQTLRELLERECFMWAIAVKMELGKEPRCVCVCFVFND